MNRVPKTIGIDFNFATIKKSPFEQDCKVLDAITSLKAGKE